MDAVHHATYQTALSRRSSGSLTSKPTFDSTSTLRKRKRDDADTTENEKCFNATIVSSLPRSPNTFITFLAITSILRAHLPLAWLSGDTDIKALSPGTTFRAVIPSVSRWDYHILIARQVPNGRLYGIELVEDNVYVCHPLRNHVTDEYVTQAAIGAAPPTTLEQLAITCVPHDHTRKSSVSSISSSHVSFVTPSSPKQPTNRRGVLARQKIMTKVNAQDAHDNGSITQSDTVISIAHGFDSLAPTCTSPQRAEINTKLRVADGQPTEETLQDDKPAVSDDTTPVAIDIDGQIDQLSTDYLRKRYLEMLYLSKTSLAFYAKGPLSRTRARARAPGASMSLAQLADFYRGAVLPSKKLDLKYRKSLACRVKALPTINNTIDVDNDPHEPRHMPQKAKKIRKSKLGKDGLWPMEDEFIERWWRSIDLVRTRAESPDLQQSELEKAISSLRMRELQLQIILVLEVFALELQDSRSTVKDSSQSKHVESGLEECHKIDVLNDVVSKDQKHDLKINLDILLDKICILHSVGSGDASTSKAGENQMTQHHTSAAQDSLRDFCKDIIIPFYSGKMHEQCSMICKKLGGPDLSPQRIKSGSDKTLPRFIPGTSLSMKDRVANQRDLERVLHGEGKSRGASAPVLLRSATLPTSSSLKRESSERPSSRGAMRKSMSFTNREIDLVADAQATAVKKRKLEKVAAQKLELEAAIEALKKPNRNMVSRVFMDDMEKRSAESRIPSKKKDAVQISATPRRANSQATPIDDYDLPPMPVAAAQDADSIIPSSANKPRGLNHVVGVNSSSGLKRAVLSAIHNTPTRRVMTETVKELPETEDRVRRYGGGNTQSSSTLVDSTPSTSRLRADLLENIASTPVKEAALRKPLFSTPLRRSEDGFVPTFKDIPDIPERANMMMDRVMKSTNSAIEMSIYDSLGWNEDDEL